MAVTLGLVAGKTSTARAPGGVGGATVRRVPRDATASLNYADWKGEVLKELEVEEWTDAQHERCGSACVVGMKQKRTRSGSSARVRQPIEYFENFFDKRKMKEFLSQWGIFCLINSFKFHTFCD